MLLSIRRPVRLRATGSGGAAEERRNCNVRDLNPLEPYRTARKLRATTQRRTSAGLSRLSPFAPLSGYWFQRLRGWQLTGPRGPRDSAMSGAVRIATCRIRTGRDGPRLQQGLRIRYAAVAPQ